MSELPHTTPAQRDAATRATPNGRMPAAPKTHIERMSDAALLDALTGAYAARRAALIDADVQQNAIYALEREMHQRFVTRRDES